MSAELIKQLLRAYSINDTDLFRKYALQLAANESRIGHTKLAEELREIISKLPEQKSEFSTSPISIAQPRGELADLIEGDYRKERLHDIILDADNQTMLGRVVLENRNRSSLQQMGLSANRRLLFFGPPGCGKTLAASVIAGELGLPLLTVRFDSLFSRFMGETAGHLRSIFNEMPRRPAVYFFDEFDAIGKHRGDASDVGEVKRVVSSFLQLLDLDKSPSLIIAATNYQANLDRAIIRRFDSIFHFTLPTLPQVAELVEMRLRPYGATPTLVQQVAKQLKGLSYVEAVRACDDSLRTMVLDGRQKLQKKDILEAFGRVQNRSKILLPNLR